ncbi:MAG: transcriptional repressor [Actinobacteria bacterium]|nr:transcriptional repressor [Actinomycetota bacterium]
MHASASSPPKSISSTSSTPPKRSHPHGSKSSDPSSRTPTSRATRQREAVWLALSSTNEFASAQELHHHLRDQGEHIGLATVYRHLQALASAGSADTIRGPQGEMLYRSCSPAIHHHHLRCSVCGRVIEVEAPQVEEWVAEIAAKNSFTLTSHTVDIEGICNLCREKTDAS